MAGISGKLVPQWFQQRQGRVWRYCTSLMGIIHITSLVVSVLCVAFAGHYLGMYRGVSIPGYDLFRPEAFYVIVAAGCLMMTSLLLVSVLATEDSQELLFRTVAPELAFGGMSALWLVASIVYMAEIVGRNMDYRIQERGFALKIITAILALAASCLNAALCVLAWRHRRSLSSLHLKTAASTELGGRSKPRASDSASPSPARGSFNHSIPPAQLQDPRRLERAPSSPPFVGVHTQQFEFSAASPSNSVSAGSLAAPSESVRRLTEKTLKSSVSLNQPAHQPPSSVNSSREPLAAPPSSPEYSRVHKPVGYGRHDSNGSAGGGDAHSVRSLAASADQVNKPPQLKPVTGSSDQVNKPRGPGRLPPLPRAPPASGANRAASNKTPSGRPPVPPSAPPANKKPGHLRSGGFARSREMRRSVSTPNDVDDPPAVPAETKFASTDHLDGDPVHMTFKQRLKMLEQRS